MPKPDLTLKDAQHIGKVTRAWSVSGSALNGFYSESERAEEGDPYKNLVRVMLANDFTAGREDLGAFLFMCMAGQKNPDGTPTYDLKDIYEPDKLLEEKVRLRRQLEELLEPAPANANQKEKDKVKANRKLADQLFSDGVKRASERLSEYADRSLKNNDMSEFMRPEAAVISKLLVPALTNFVEGSKNHVATLKENALVSRLKDIDFDIAEYANNYVGIVNFGAHLGQTVANIETIASGRKAISTMIGMENYLGFANIMDKYKKNPNYPVTKVFESATRAQLEQRVDEGQEVSLEDFSPTELGFFLVGEVDKVLSTVEISGSKEAAEEFLEENRHDPEVQQMKSFIKGIGDITSNAKEPEYTYGIAIMNMNGRLYPNLSFKADINVKEQTIKEAGKPDVIKHNLSIGNVSFKFDNILDRKTVLKEAFLSDLDIEPYKYAPIDEFEKEISEINTERTNTITELSNTINGLKPLAGASQEWKEMLYAAERAKKISDEYQKKYADLEEGEGKVNEAEKQAELEKVTSAMELARNAAHNYVVHKVDSGKYTEGKDYQRLQVAKKLEKFGEQQCTYLNVKAAENLNSVHEEKGYFNEDSMVSDYENVGNYRSAINKLGQKTTFRSNEFDDMVKSISKLQQLQGQILDDKTFDTENDRKYFGGPDESGVYLKGYVEKTIESIDAYIAHRHKEGITKDLYADRVDAASRLKRYLETIKAGADRKRAERLEEQADKKIADANQKAFKEKYDEAKKILSDAYDVGMHFNVVPGDRIPAIKDAICTMYAYQKFINETKLIKSRELNSYEASTVDKVNIGRYNEIINDFKAKQNYEGSFVNRSAGGVGSIQKILIDDSFSKMIKDIDREIEERKPISEDATFKSVHRLTTSELAKCKETANGMPEGEIDARFLANYMVHRLTLSELDMIAKLPANGKENQSKLATICIEASDDNRTNSMVREISRSRELEAVIERYSDQKNLGDKLEAMYHDYAKLKVYTAKHNRELPDDVDKYLQDDGVKKEGLNKPAEKAKNVAENEAKRQMK